MGVYESRVSHLNFLLLVLLGTFFYLIDLLGVIQIIQSLKSETRQVIKLTTYRVYRGVYIVLVYIDFSSIPGVQIGVVSLSLSVFSPFWRTFLKVLQHIRSKLKICICILASLRLILYKSVDLYICICNLQCLLFYFSSTCRNLCVSSVSFNAFLHLTGKRMSIILSKGDFRLDL